MGGCCGKQYSVKAKGKGHSLQGNSQHPMTAEERRQKMAEAAEKRQHQDKNKGVSRDGQVDRDFKEQRQKEAGNQNERMMSKKDYN